MYWVKLEFPSSRQVRLVRYFRLGNVLSHNVMYKVLIMMVKIVILIMMMIILFMM